MDRAEIAKTISIFLLSGVKLLFAPGAATAAGFSFHKTLLVTSCGGCTGILTFYYLGYYLTEQFSALFSRMKIVNPDKAPRLGRRVFTRRKRFVIKVRRRFGMFGLALLTPSVISIPIGAVVSARFYRQDKLMLPMLLISTVLWCFVLTLFSLYIKQIILDF